MNLLKELNELAEEIQLAEYSIIEQLIIEGIDDPGILKCVFMAGGPGSGKSFTAQEIFGIDKRFKSSVSSFGLKSVNSDAAFEAGLRKNGINPKDLARIEKEDPELWAKITMGDNSIRGKAKKITQQQQAFYEAGRLGMIIDGTGDNYSKIQNQKKRAEELGYDTYMVFVNTSLEVALIRNAERDRTLPEDIVVESWKECQENMGKFQGLFGSSKFTIVDNTEYKKSNFTYKHHKTGKTVAVPKPLQPGIIKAVNTFLSKPIYNPIGKKWMEMARMLKSSKYL